MQGIQFVDRFRQQVFQWQKTRTGPLTALSDFKYSAFRNVDKFDRTSSFRAVTAGRNFAANADKLSQYGSLANDFSIRLYVGRAWSVSDQSAQKGQTTGIVKFAVFVQNLRQRHHIKRVVSIG